MKTIVRNIRQLATPLGERLRKGAEMAVINEREHVDICLSAGRFLRIGRDLNLEIKPEDTVIDASGLVATPAFVDPHTHIPFFGFREKEFFLRQRGAGYLEILQAGGGILETTRQVRAASLEDLIGFNLPFVYALQRKGVLVLEGKSGYGLDRENEWKQLEALSAIEKITGTKVFKTFMGPHAIPPEFPNADAAIDWLCAEVLEELAKNREMVDFLDVFCEKGVFNYAQSERYLEKGKALGFKTRLHAEEMSFEGGSLLGAKVGASSVDHLIAIEPAGIHALANSDTVATLLPGTSLFLNKPFAPARNLIDAGVGVALASDFNPGSCTFYDPTIIAFLAASKYKMTPAEILTAQTLNAASSLGVADSWGSIEEGKIGGLLLWDVPDFTAIPYLPGHERLRFVIGPVGILRL
ncbi:MAG TPA: imidazolonepropionase [Thermotogota bacterium]|nr:imidazolonepropionase [Thermotogota bacterium]OQC31520.1 MAG: Imidazolonepropionase [Thermotogota bacterium ADurb.Bin062]HNW46490.1 imidazolonepropionase [Thermotogota bacterium]HNY81994.1 imidazolonepropionase [Thermotogota bacterium]HOD91087.1 imidazolonepropionase [Thermotogota bacterium]